MEFTARSGNVAIATLVVTGPNNRISVNVGWYDDPSDSDLQEFVAWYAEQRAKETGREVHIEGCLKIDNELDRRTAALTFAATGVARIPGRN